jgi:hypothetical protein
VVRAPAKFQRKTGELSRCVTSKGTRTFTGKIPGRFSRCDYRLDGPGFVSRQGASVFFISESRPAARSPHPHIQWVVGFFPGIKMTGAEIKNVWSPSSTPAVFFHGVDRENKYFNFFYRILANGHAFPVRCETKYCAYLSVGSCL